MFKGLWKKVLGKDPVASSSDSFIEKDIRLYIEKLLFSPYMLPQKECAKFLARIGSKNHKFHKKYTNKKEIQVLDMISKNNFKYGRSAPERFIQIILEMIMKKNVDVLLGKKVEKYETDIYVDKLNCVFEVQGFNWHYENSKKIHEDTQRAKHILENVENLFFITPIKGKSLIKTSHRFELFVYIFPQIISNIKSIDGHEHYVKNIFLDCDKDCLMIQKVILEMRKMLSQYPTFEF